MIRGNIDSRISKVKRGEYDGTILALAGIQTLKLDHEIKEIFSEEKIIPCAGQGVIAVQCRKDDFENLKILEKINDQDTKICALTERSLLKTIGGDCHTAVGVYAKIDKTNIVITSQLFSDNGLKSFSIKKTGSKSCFLPNLQQPRTSTEKQKGASIPGATFWFSVDVRGCWRFGRKHDLELGF